MVCIPERTAIQIPILKREREKALSLAKLQPNQREIASFYQGYLASLAMLNYLHIQDISATLEPHYELEQSGNLRLCLPRVNIPKLRGYLQCFASQSNPSNPCFLTRVDGDCIGYIIVELNEQCTDGSLLGYAREDCNGPLRLEDFGSIDNFLDRFIEIELREVVPL